MNLLLVIRNNPHVVTRWGLDSNTITAFPLSAGIRSQLFSFPVITVHLSDCKSVSAGSHETKIPLFLKIIPGNTALTGATEHKILKGPLVKTGGS